VEKRTVASTQYSMAASGSASGNSHLVAWSIRGNRLNTVTTLKRRTKVPAA
jgi:hypothetical protein